MNTVLVKRPQRLTVSNKALQSAASRLLPKGGKLVTPEIAYIKRQLGHTATQNEIDEQVMGVRRITWQNLFAE